jgi:hypothetical protein
MSHLNDLDLVAIASLSDPTCKSTNLAGSTPEVLRAAREARARAVREMAWALGAWLKRIATAFAKLIA